MVYGRDGLPVPSEDGQRVLGWVTNNRILHTVAQKINTAQQQTAQAQMAAEWALPDPEAALREPPTPLRGYQILEITIEPRSPAAGHELRTITWPLATSVVSVLHNRRLRDPEPGVGTAPGPDGQGDDDGRRSAPAYATAPSDRVATATVVRLAVSTASTAA